MGVGGGAGAVADAVIVSFTLQTIKEDLIADALPISISQDPFTNPAPLPCPQLVLCPWCLVLCENYESVSERSDPPCLISLVHMPASCGLLACACALITLVLAAQGLPALQKQLWLEKAPSSPVHHTKSHSCDPPHPTLTSPLASASLSASSPPLLFSQRHHQISTSCAAHSISRPRTFASILPSARLIRC